MYSKSYAETKHFFYDSHSLVLEFKKYLSQMIGPFSPLVRAAGDKTRDAGRTLLWLHSSLLRGHPCPDGHQSWPSGRAWELRRPRPGTGGELCWVTPWSWAAQTALMAPIPQGRLCPARSRSFPPSQEAAACRTSPDQHGEALEGLTGSLRPGH